MRNYNKKTCIVILSTCRVHPSREMWNVVNFKIGATTKKKHNNPRGEVDDDIHSGTLVPDYAHAIARPTRRHVPKNASRFLNRLFDSVLDSVFRRNSSHLHIMQAACDMWHVCCNNIRSTGTDALYSCWLTKTNRESIELVWHRLRHSICACQVFVGHMTRPKN